MNKDIVLEFKADLTLVIKNIQQEKPIEEYKAELCETLRKTLKETYDDAHIKDIQVFEFNKE